MQILPNLCVCEQQIQDYDHSVTFPSLRFEYASVALSKSGLVLVWLLASQMYFIDSGQICQSTTPLHYTMIRLPSAHQQERSCPQSGVIAGCCTTQIKDISIHPWSSLPVKAVSLLIVISDRFRTIVRILHSLPSAMSMPSSVPQRFLSVFTVVW